MNQIPFYDALKKKVETHQDGMKRYAFIGDQMMRDHVCLHCGERMKQLPSTYCRATNGNQKLKILVFRCMTQNGCPNMGVAEPTSEWL